MSGVNYLTNPVQTPDITLKIGLIEVAMKITDTYIKYPMDRLRSRLKAEGEGTVMLYYIGIQAIGLLAIGLGIVVGGFLFLVLVMGLMQLCGVKF